MSKLDMDQKIVDRLPPSLNDDLTVNSDLGVLFMTHIFSDGNMLGFWSHSPWGTCHDQEVGWAVVNENLEVIDSCATLDNGYRMGDIKGWLQSKIQLHGKRTKLKPKYELEGFWRLSDY